jgi:hypothetical protein
LLDLINRSTKKPTANIKLNVIWLNTFPQRLGIIQIYALLQLQFAISLEIIIRQMIEIKEISLYVDNVTIYVAVPKQSIQKLLELIYMFNKVSE